MKATNRKVKVRIISLVALLAYLFCSASAAFALNDITVRLYDQRELIAGSYTSFCQDAEGFIWIGTDAGLVRFDGNHCDLFRNDELVPGSVSDNKIVTIFCDRDGLLWVGTVNGLNYFDSKSETFRHVELPGMQLNGYISGIADFNDGKLLFLVAGIGFYTLDKKSLDKEDGKLEAERLKFGLKDDNGISKIVGLGERGILFTVRSGEICILTPDCKFKTIATLNGNPNHLSLESKNSLVVTTMFDAFRLNLESGVLTPLNITGGETIKITDAYSGGDVTYISTGGSGVWEVEKGSPNVARSRRLNSSFTDFSLMKVGSVFIDRAGNLWIGCNHKGVGMAPSSKGPFENKSLVGLLSATDGVEVVCQKVVDDNHIALGLNNGSIVLLDSDGNERKVTVSHGNQITSIANMTDGKLLIGVARDGVWTLDTKSLAVTRLVKPSSPYPGVVATVGKKGEIVAAFGELGVLRYDLSTGNEKWFYPASGSNLLPAFYYAGISTSADGKIWIGGYSGLACYDPVSDGLLPIDQNPFIKGVVYDVCDCDDGVMIATDRGLVRYSLQKGVMKKYTIANGLPDNDIRTLQRDGKGGIWIGTMKGLAYLKDSVSNIQTFGGNLGVARTQYVFSDRMPRSGRLLVGNYESMTLFNPDSVKQSTFGADVMITGVYLNGKRITPDSRSGSKVIVEGDLSFPKALHISHKNNFLVLRLSTLDFRDASDLRYEWQLDGEGDVWHSASQGESMIYLPQLESGKHKLRIRGWENEVCSATRELKLDVRPPMVSVKHGLRHLCRNIHLYCRAYI